MDIQEPQYISDEYGAYLFIDKVWNEIDENTGEWSPVVLH